MAKSKTTRAVSNSWNGKIYAMDNPYESSVTGDARPDTEQPKRPNRTSNFFAWYLGAFIVSTVLWKLSRHVARLDFLEVPMVLVHFPPAGFFDPHDAMLHNKNIFFYAILFWAAVAPVALLLPSRRFSPIAIGLGIIGAFAAASVAYTFLYHILS